MKRTNTKSSFKGMVTSFEKSNPGYQWNWDEASLSGKLVGILFRNEEWEWDGKSGWAVRPFRAISIDSVRSGDFTIPKDKPLKSKTSNQSLSDIFFPQSERPQTFAEIEDNGDLPF